MSLSLTKTVRCLLAASLLFCFVTSSAQDKYEKLSFRIDSLANVGLPKSALKEVDKLDEMARADNNSPQQIKAVIYRMTFQSYLEEDALVAIITRLKTDVDNAEYPVKPVLQSLLAEIYWNYYKDNRYQYGRRERQEKKDADFRNWDVQNIIDEASRLYAVSLQEAGKEQDTPVSVLDGVLQGDKETRYLRPTLYDLLVHRAFDFYLSDEASINKPKLPFSLNDARLFADSRTFAELAIKTTDTASTLYKGVKFLQQATLFHLQKNNRDALAALDLQRLETFHSQSKLPNRDSLYIRALRQISVDFSASQVSASALFSIGNYYKDRNDLLTAYSYYKKAIAAHPKSIGGKNAAAAVKEIEGQDLSATVENINVPGKPLLGLVHYSNVKEAKIAIYKVSMAQIQQMAGANEANNTMANTNAKILKLLNSLQSVQVMQLSLPGTEDYRQHTAEFKIDALPVGLYILMIDGPKGGVARLKQWVNFTITSLAYTTRPIPGGQTEVLVVDRDNGKPLAGVKVNLNHRADNKGKREKTVVFSGLSDKNGRYLFKADKRQNYDIELAYKNDHFDSAETYFGEMWTGYNTDNDKPHTSTILFTDRQLYRPGQTIYFKGLRIRTTNGKSEIIPDEAVEVRFRDLNYQTVSTLNINANEFGSIQGSFIIPQNIASGRLEITASDGSVSINVEEYKRPTYKVEFLPVAEAYTFSDSVKLKGRVTAFSGYGISNAKVAFHVTAAALPGMDDEDVNVAKMGSIWGRAQEVAADTIYTNNNGEFEVKFKAGDADEKAADITLTYAVEASVTDASGETQTANNLVAISSRPVKIETTLPEKLSAEDDSRIPVRINNTNEQAQKGKVTIKMYALKQARTFLKSRIWDHPDKLILTRDEFKKAFPAYPWQHEEEPKTWEVTDKLSEATITVDSVGGTIDLGLLKKQPAGYYKITVSARTDKGDTTSITRFVEVTAGPPAALKNKGPESATKTVKPGGQVEFMVGIDKPSRILMEKYDGQKLRSSEWLVLDGPFQQKITVAVPATEKNSFAVQFLMVNDNRVYRSYYQIKVVDSIKKLGLRFITFRNKLQPGEKEHWALEVKSGDNEKQAVEMLAAMYDASLDDIAPRQYWRTDYGDEPQYIPNYYSWMDHSFTSEEATIPFSNSGYVAYPTAELDYEHLNLFGYEYYGGNNNGYETYLQQIADYKATQKADKKLADKYFTNAALVKKGYDISGRVVAGDDGLNGIKITIKGTGISTFSNSLGYFKIKVPVNGVLVFSGKYYSTKTVSITAARTMAVEMEYKAGVGGVVLRELKFKNGKEESLHGVQNGYMSVSADKSVAQYAPAPMVAAAAAPPASIDMLKGSRNKDVVMREISVGAAGKFAKPIIARKNFNETAFFYPQLHTDEKGQILIDFTIPEALTRWRFRGFAHTKGLQTGYIEDEVITQKQLSISANTPRFLREGDTIAISARLANLTTETLKGTVKMQLFNALNMQPVNLFLNKADAEQNFEVNASTNKAVTFNLLIPAGLDALTYRLTADGGQFTDGEENTLPVLPNRTLVTESVPMMVRAGQSRSFTFDRLLNEKSPTLQNKTLTLEYTQNPAWYAVQALPYMMEFPYECSEQIFSRYYANSLATNLVNRLPAIKQVFEQWKSANSTELLSNLEKNQELKTTLIEETPWLKDAVSETEQKKRIALLFDLNKMSDELRANLQKLKDKQLPDGGFPWFGGERSDRYISQHILQGIGELKHLNITNEQLDAIYFRAIIYMDRLLVEDDKAQKKDKDYATRPLSPIEIQAWFTRSYFLNKVMDDATQAAQANYLKRAAAQWTMRNVYEQAMIALTMHRYKKPAVTQQIEKSLLETAQQSDDMGMYWAKNQRGYFWYESPVETQSMMIELFTEAGDNAKAVEEMKIWLLRNKQANNWKTTTATAAACYALLLKGGDILATTGTTEIKLNGKRLEELKPDVKADAGTGYIKTSWADDQVKPALGKIDIKNNSTNLSWGALHWQYLENLDKITGAQTNIQLTRKYFIRKQTDAGAVLVAVDAAHQPKTGDVLKVVINLKADRDFEYVQLKDLRPAGTEPVEAISAYKYQDGLYYYQVNKDVATSFFISYLNKGNYVFEYQLRVAQPGNFSTGITTIQSMYAPEFNAHSDGGRMGIKP